MPNLVAYESFRSLLQDRLEARKQRNPAYSLRAFARNIGMSPSRLSEVMNAGQHMSVRSAERIGPKLFANEQELRYFVCLVEADTANNNVAREMASERLREIRQSLSAAGGVKS